MSLQLLVTTAASVAAEAEGEPPIPVWGVGLIAFAILMSLLIALVVFGGGREHS